MFFNTHAKFFNTRRDVRLQDRRRICVFAALTLMCALQSAKVGNLLAASDSDGSC